ncbi:LysR family transcriptional regulator [Burkholderia lata]|uniref:LysR family transcriptional regulator n=1 Tax=Burkholderia lata (strain ATCC 17760 / DSM 23089 / LMG 22485 / NCIMB 9086 / R18194 / 383) TaxID=482957 RepID=UPI0014531159|nr:LysR family transcriptional regulator [Burkholderia lata]VWB87477.1 LysR family transcriptional regulator [Burkholderia lata]
MRNIDLDSLQIFKAVVDFGGVTKAAAHLNRVQSNITTRVKNLEDRLGVALFQRQGGKLVPSAEGRLLLGYAERLLRLSSEAETALRCGTPRGTLRIGTLESTAAARLPPFLSRYHERYPDVHIELVTGTTTALISRVQRYDVEAAFISEPFHAAELETQVAFSEELVLIAPQNATQIKSARHLQQCTVIAFATGCSYRRILEDWLTASEVVPERVLELASYHAIVACVAAGSGIAIVPRSVLKAVHAESQVKVLPLPPNVAKVRTHLVWTTGHHSVALNALRDELGRK